MISWHYYRFSAKTTFANAIKFSSNNKRNKIRPYYHNVIENRSVTAGQVQTAVIVLFSIFPRSNPVKIDSKYSLLLLTTFSDDDDPHFAWHFSPVNLSQDQMRRVYY